MNRLSDTAFVILLTLAQAKAQRAHGYAILQEAKQHNGVSLQVGALYTTLARLLEMGFISEDLPMQGERTRPYVLTRTGLATLREQAQERATLARQLLTWLEMTP